MLTARQQKNRALFGAPILYDHDDFVENFENWFLFESSISRARGKALVYQLKDLVDEAIAKGFSGIPPTPPIEFDIMEDDDDDDDLITEEDRLALSDYTKNIMQDLVGQGMLFSDEKRRRLATWVCRIAGVPETLQETWNLHDKKTSDNINVDPK